MRENYIPLNFCFGSRSGVSEPRSLGGWTLTQVQGYLEIVEEFVIVGSGFVKACQWARRSLQCSRPCLKNRNIENSGSESAATAVGGMPVFRKRSVDSQDLVKETDDIFPHQVVDHYCGREPGGNQGVRHGNDLKPVEAVRADGEDTHPARASSS